MKTGILLLVFGLVLSASAQARNGADANDSCTTREPDNARVSYDGYGRLSRVIDDRNHMQTDFTYDRDAIHVSQTARIGYQSYSAEGFPKELWGPTRWSEYNAATGALQTVHTYHDYNYTTEGLQTSWQITGSRGSQLTAQSDGTYDYLGNYTKEDVEYNVVKTGRRHLRVTEPLNIKSATCISLGGQSYALHSDTAYQPPFKSFAVKTITGDVSESRAELARYENGDRFATKVIGASPSAEDVRASIYSSDYSYDQTRVY